jgi:hypothetical protein
LIVTDIVFIFQVQTGEDWFFAVRDKNNQRYELPQIDYFVGDPYKGYTYPMNRSMVGLTYSQTVFDFRIYRR